MNSAIDAAPADAGSANPFLHPRRSYAEFLASKAIDDPMTGLTDIPDLPAELFPFQRDIVAWALRRGRAALLAGTGLGKSLMELAWGQAVAEATGGMVLLFAPLAVAAQMLREAAKFGIPARLVATQAECGPGINITNYQKLEHFDLRLFIGVILDESSILKSTTRCRDGGPEAGLPAHASAASGRASHSPRAWPAGRHVLGRHHDV